MKQWKFFFLSLGLLVAVVSTLSTADEIHSIKKGAWNSTSVWSGGAIPTAADNVTITRGDSVRFDTTWSNGTTTIECNNLTVNGSLRFSQNIACTMTIYGNFVVNSGGYCTMNTSKVGVLVHHLNLYGNLMNFGQLDCKTGTAGSNWNICHVAFLGSANDTINLRGGYSTINNEVGGVTINKSGAGRLVLQSDLVLPSGSSSNPSDNLANPILYLTRGIIETGPFAVVHLWTSSLGVVGGSDSCYCLGAMGRGMGNSAGASKELFVGDADGFRPIKVRSTTSGNGTGNYALVRAIPGDANTGASTLSSDIDKVSKVRYYQLTYHAIPAGSSTPPWPMMDFDRFYPSYGLSDGVAAGNTSLRVAYSIDNRASWIGMGPTHPSTTHLDSLPRLFSPDSLIPPISIDTSAESPIVYIALARAAGTTENSLEPGLQATCQYTVATGWNLVSIPMVVTNSSKSALFPSSTSNAFMYVSGQGYVQRSTMENKLGYWLKFDAPQSVTLSGAPHPLDTIMVSPGWNMIGSVSSPVLTTSVTQIPDNNIISPFYYFTSSYVTSETIQPGKGYWVKTTQPGILILQGAASAQSASAR